MARPISKMRRASQALMVDDREALLLALFVELDEPAEEYVEGAWLEEAQRRSKELVQGTVKPMPAEEIFDRFRSRLAE